MRKFKFNQSETLLLGALLDSLFPKTKDKMVQFSFEYLLTNILIISLCRFWEKNVFYNF